MQMYSESSMGTLSFGIPDIVLGVLLRMVLGIAADTDLRMGIAALGFALDIAYRIPVCTLLHIVFELRRTDFCILLLGFHRWLVLHGFPASIVLGTALEFDQELAAEMFAILDAAPDFGQKWVSGILVIPGVALDFDQMAAWARSHQAGWTLRRTCLDGRYN